MENLNDLLAGCDAAKNSFSKRLLFNAGDEFFGDLKIDIGFEQSQSHLSQRGVDVRFADRAVSTQVSEDILKFVGELRKHNQIKGPKYATLVAQPNGAKSSRGRARPHAGTRAAPESSRDHFLGVAAGAAPPAVPSSIPKVQCVSTFLSCDFALIMT